MKKLKICVLPGDGIGIDVMNVALPILKEMNIDHELIFGKIGF
jgi:isocitrate/isopropylmalate dehydrogenase